MSVCVHSYMHVYASILHLSLFDRNAAASTLSPQHTLPRQCVSERQRYGVCLRCSNEQRKKGGDPLRNLRKKKKGRRGEDGEGERERYGGRLRGQISEKVEWDIWKRERVTGTRRKLQLPNNDSLGKILFYISLSSLSSSNLST